MGKAAKRARKKEGRRTRIEAETKAAEKRRKRNMNLVFVGIVVVVLAIIGYTQLTKKTKKVAVKSTPSASAQPSPSSSAAGVAVTPTATPSVTTSAAAGATTTTAATCPAAPKPAQGDHSTQASPPPMTVSASKTYTATFNTTCGTFVVALDVKDSPNTVNSIVYLANKGFFNGLTFHRISKGANVIQGGDPNGDGSGSPGYQVVDPVPASVSSGNYGPGLVAMAKTSAAPAGSAGSQFFVVPDGVTSQIGPSYGVLGTVSSGLDVVTKIFNDVPASGGPSYDGPPAVPVYINTVTITTQ